MDNNKGEFWVYKPYPCDGSVCDGCCVDYSFKVTYEHQSDRNVQEFQKLLEKTRLLVSETDPEEY